MGSMEVSWAEITRLYLTCETSGPEMSRAFFELHSAQRNNDPTHWPSTLLEPCLSQGFTLSPVLGDLISKKHSNSPRLCLCVFQCPRLIASFVLPVLRGAGPSQPGIIAALSGPFSVKDVVKFVDGFRKSRGWRRWWTPGWASSTRA